MRYPRVRTIAWLSVTLAAATANLLPAQDTPAASGSVTAAAEAQPDATEGPVIENYGAVYPVPGDAYNLVRGKRYKVVMDISGTGEFAMAINPHLDSAARFLNMEARTGIDPHDLKLALVVHGKATKDLLNDQAYREHFGVHNPNTRLLDALEATGVEILVCGQSAAAKGFRPGEFNPAARIAVSAMSAHVRLQAEGYVEIPF